MDVIESVQPEVLFPTLAERLSEGEIAIFPTDTIYGFTADARHFEAVEKILRLKRRRTPVSCIPPSVDWARQLLDGDEVQKAFQETIPEYFGRYTTLWPSRGSQTLHPCVETESLIGLRFPEHWIREFAQATGIPLTTTSVNRTGESPMRCLQSLDPELRNEVDFMVNEGALDNPPSQILRWQDGRLEKLKR